MKNTKNVMVDILEPEPVRPTLRDTPRILMCLYASNLMKSTTVANFFKLQPLTSPKPLISGSTWKNQYQNREATVGWMEGKVEVTF